MEDKNAYALIGIGHLYYDFKEYKDALYYWTKMLEINADAVDIRVLTSIGNCHRKLKTFDKGIKYFERALEMDPENFYVLFGSGNRRFFHGLHSAALSASAAVAGKAAAN